MGRFLSLLLAVLGAGTILAAVLGYLPLRDYALNGTPGFNPKSHFVLGPLSLGIESALAKSSPVGLIDAAAYCIALQRRLLLLAAVGLAVLFISLATARLTVERK
ncbi:MAG: hypothetical protein SFV81_17880 [Pirellulaceae bacterium]|nr:hypothetical protein [Pirellulaceae bacterium]